jgi:hypothetical protein
MNIEFIPLSVSIRSWGANATMAVDQPVIDAGL